MNYNSKSKKLSPLRSTSYPYFTYYSKLKRVQIKNKIRNKGKKTKENQNIN